MQNNAMANRLPAYVAESKQEKDAAAQAMGAALAADIEDRIKAEQEAIEQWGESEKELAIPAPSSGDKG